MLQRSPTYVVSGSAEDRLANMQRKYLRVMLADNLSRFSKVLLQACYIADLASKQRKATSLTCISRRLTTRGINACV
jgi:hypothetical protein